jgi:hypothetical protein
MLRDQVTELKALIAPYVRRSGVPRLHRQA